MTNPGVTNVDVSGGANGMDAKYDDLLEMGRLTGEVAEDALKTAAAGHKFLVEPEVLASSLLNPGGVVKFEAAMAVALDGPNGLTATSAGIGLRADGKVGKMIRGVGRAGRSATSAAATGAATATTSRATPSAASSTATHTRWRWSSRARTDRAA